MPLNKKKSFIYNIIFAVVGTCIVLFLYNAPPETTKKLPQDVNHLKFYSMGKKAAEKFCEDCHNPNDVPMPEKHIRNKNRCLFCHKKIKK